MPSYKHRTIKLTPKRHDDETWSCAYRIIDISSSGWRFHKGHSYGSFASREQAATAALEDAKRIVDTYPGKTLLCTHQSDISLSPERTPYTSLQSPHPP